MEMLEKNW